MVKELVSLECLTENAINIFWKCLSVAERLGKLCEHYDSKDTRYAKASHLLHLNIWIIMEMKSFLGILKDKKSTEGIIVLAENQRPIFMSQYDTTLRQSFIVKLQFDIEQLFKKLSRAVGMNDGGGFYRLYKELLKKLGLIHLEDCFEFMRCIRNSLHNDGYYYDTRHPKVSVKLRGITYDFHHMSQITCAGWVVLCTCFDEILNGIVEIYSHKLISKLSSC